MKRVFLLVLLIVAVYWQFFLLGKIPVPTDTLVGAYYPWLDYKWGYEVGVPVKNPPISDVFSQFFLWKYLSLDLIKSGEWPLWNPYSFSGTPLLATYHSATLLPFNILLFLPKYMGWGMYIFGQTLVAALGIYFLLGKYVKTEAPKIAGSLVFSLSGLMATWVEFGTGVWATAVLPWVFLFLTKYWETRKIRFLSLLTFSFVCLFLAGHTQLTLYSSLLFFLFCVYQIFTKQIKKHLVFLPVIFLALAVGLVALQFLPTIDLANYSVRADEEYTSTFNYGLNGVYELIRLFAADFFGNPTTYNYWGSVSYHEQTSFLGTLTLVFIIPLILKFRTKENIFWITVFLGSIFLSIDHPLTKWFYSLPLPFLTYSSASRVFFITSFAAGILLAIGLQKLQDENIFYYWVRRSTVILLSLLIGSLIFVLFAYSANFQIALRNSFLPAILLLGMLLLSFFRKKWIVYLVVALIFIDLSRYFLKYNPFVSPLLVFPTTPVIEFLKEQQGDFRIARADWEIMPPNTWIEYRLSSVEGYDPLALLNYAKVFNIINGNNYYNRTTMYVLLGRYPSKHLDSLNVKYFLGIKREREVTGSGLLSTQAYNSNLKQVFEDKNSVIFENPNYKERAYFVSQVASVKNSQELVKKISAKDYNPTKEAVLVGDLNLSLSQGVIKESNFKPNYAQLLVETKERGFMIVSNTYEKGWLLSLNGEERPIFEVNGAQQGFEIPPGLTKVELKYFPKSFELGLKISLISLVIMILINIYSMIKRIW